MANLRLANLARNAAADQLTAKIDAGAGSGTIKIYSGTQPATADTALSGNTLLGTLTFSKPSFGASANGTITANAIAQESNSPNTGVATFARIQDSNGNTVFDCDVGTASATCIINTTSITAGGTVQCTSFTVTVPNT